MTDLKTQYDTLLVNYKQLPDDNPENVLWYARYFALKEIIIENGGDLERFETIIHKVASWGCLSWETTITQLRYVTPMIPLKPERPYRYRLEPVDDTEIKARELFNSQFKRSFPGKRLKSKFANEKWEAVREQALGFAQIEYQKQLDEYNSWKVEQDKEYQITLDKWEVSCNNARHIQAVITKITNPVPA